VPPLPGLQEVGCVTSDTLREAFSKLDAVPAPRVVSGGGPVDCELAQSFARLGSRVTQVEVAPRLLLREDEEVSELAREALTRDGVAVRTGHQAFRCERGGERKFMVVEHQGGELRIEFDALLCAVGRVARLQGYGLEVGIDTRRTVAVNDYLETLYPNIYAAGDVAGPYPLTHVAAHQAWHAAVNALFSGFKKFKVDYRVIHRVTFTAPEVARVGLDEKEARAQGIAFEISRYGIDDPDRAIADGAAQGFVQRLTVPGKDRILGLNKILGTIRTYPMLSKANKYTAGEWTRAHAPQKVLRWLERFHHWRRG
jgi:pyruvate/2-oxoglutarate dehydrogenase complex dihydrolipoamide dehydrogenase (E3) component